MSIAKKLHTIAENMQKVYDAGANTGGGGNYDEGYQSGYAEGEAEGRKSQCDEFWDDFQQNGERTVYSYGFAGVGWSDENFKPKYNIAPVGNTASYIFAQTRITNLKRILEDCGVTLDFSQVTTMNYPFQGSNITDVGVIDVRSMSELKYFLFGSRSLKSVEKLVLRDDGSQILNATYTFGNCESLTHMLVEGVIGQNGFDVHWSPLDIESLVSIMNALQDKTTDTSGTVWKVTLGAANKAKLSADELKMATDKGWIVE